MLKRILISGALALLVIVFIFTYLLTRTNTFESAEASEAVPADAILFADRLDLEYFSSEFIDENQLWDEFREASIDFHFYDSLLREFAHMLESRPKLSELTAQGPLSISIHLMGKSKLSAILYLALEGQSSLNDLEAELNTLFGDDAIINERKYEALNIKDVSFRNDGPFSSISYAQKDGLFIISASSILLEDAIRTLNAGGGIRHRKGFSMIQPTAGKFVHANLYLNYRLLDQLFFPAVESRNHKQLSFLAGIGDWGELDADLNPEALVLNGMSYAEDSLNQLLNLFKDQSPVKMEAASFIPSNAIYYVWSGMSSTEKVLDEINKYYRSMGRAQELHSEDLAIESLLEVNPLKDLAAIMDDELVLFHLPGSGPGEIFSVSGVEVKSRSEAVTRLRSWTLNYAANKEIDHSRLVSTFVLDDQSSYDIYHLPEPFYDEFLPGLILKPYFTFFEHFIFFSDSREALSRTIYQNVLNKTLAHESSYREVNNYLSSKSNLSCYIRPDQYIGELKGIMNQRSALLASDLEPVFKKIPGLVFQFANEGELFYSNFSMAYSGRARERSLTAWESLLDSTVAIKPALVINHNTGEKEILVQDAGQVLYLINGTGRILWKIKLEGRIMSEIFQIDYYQNGKLQYLFNTQEALHLIDRNGNYVERYPVKFSEDATNGMALFDYDKRKEYRIFVACEDRKLYVYDIEGNIVSGWRFSGAEGMIMKPVQHFRVKEKDYIVFSDPLRSYIVDRRGKERVKQKELLAVSRNNMFYLDMNLKENRPRLISTDTGGNIIGVDLRGNIETILAHEASTDHFFQIKDMDQDGSAEYIFADKNELKVIDSEGERFFSYKIKNDIEMLPDIYQFSGSDLKIGITDPEENRIHLINKDGSAYEDFPLKGNTRFSIGYFKGSDSRFNLIVGSADGFIYNYSIE